MPHTIIVVRPRPGHAAFSRDVLDHSRPGDRVSTTRAHPHPKPADVQSFCPANGPVVQLATPKRPACTLGAPKRPVVQPPRPGHRLHHLRAHMPQRGLVQVRMDRQRQDPLGQILRNRRRAPSCQRSRRADGAMDAGNTPPSARRSPAAAACTRSRETPPAAAPHRSPTRRSPLPAPASPPRSPVPVIIPATRARAASSASNTVSFASSTAACMESNRPFIPVRSTS